MSDVVGGGGAGKRGIVFSSVKSDIEENRKAAVLNSDAF